MRHLAAPLACLLLWPITLGQVVHSRRRSCCGKCRHSRSKGTRLSSHLTAAEGDRSERARQIGRVEKTEARGPSLFVQLGSRAVQGLKVA